MIEQLKKLGFKKDEKSHVWISNSVKEFAYSDGDGIENYLLESIRSANDRSVNSKELNQYIKDWPTFYHLSPRRSNIVRSFGAYLKGKNVLEIGCGCGALSRYLGEIGVNLLAVEGSNRRALITRERCYGLENVEIVSANSEMVEGLEGFDVVILNGVLEYSPQYLGVNGPSLLLKTCYNQLNQDGILIVAIENQLGIKYFSGQPEDHAGLVMYGINNSYREGEFKTWGKKELTNLILKSGFQSIEQFIPLPDYKLPITVVTPLGWEKYPEELVHFPINSVINDPQRTSYDLFSLELGYHSIWKNGLAADLANSFLMVVGKNGNQSGVVPDNLVVLHFGEGNADNLIEGSVIFVDDDQLKEKTIVGDENVNQILEDSDRFTNIFQAKGSYWIELLYILNRPDWTKEDISDWAKIWIVSIFEINSVSEGLSLAASIDAAFFKNTPFNSFRQPDGKISHRSMGSKKDKKVKIGSVIFAGLIDSFQRIGSVDRFRERREIGSIELIKYVFFRIFSYQLHNSEIMNFQNESKENSVLFGDLNFFKVNPKSDILNQRRNVSELENSLNLVVNSFSWKFTKPIRKFLKMCRDLF